MIDNKLPIVEEYEVPTLDGEPQNAAQVTCVCGCVKCKTN